MSPEQAARRESFYTLPETCATVDSIFDVACGAVKEQTEALREAWLVSLAEKIELEERVEDLERELSVVLDELAEAKS